MMQTMPIPGELQHRVAGDATHPSGHSADRPGRMTSLRDVAKEAKVSAATVSMVINGNPRISRATATRIHRVIEQMGYQPNRLAQSLSSKYTNVVAIMLPALRHAFADAYFGEIISGVCDKAGKLGYKIMLEQAKPEFVKDKQHVRIFERRFVDGVLCLGTNDKHRWLADFAVAGCPAVLVDNAVDEMKIDSVASDYASGAEQVMNYLFQLGHRRIGLIGAAPEIQTSRRVRRVFDQMLGQSAAAPLNGLANGTPNDSSREASRDSVVADGKFTEEGGATAAESLLTVNPDLTALFCTNDKMAIGAMYYALRSGRRLPQDLSIVGFDNLRHAAFVNPALTTVHLPLYEVGATAMERLVERIHGRVEPVREILKTHLVLRQSTAMARGAMSRIENAAR